MAKKPVKKVLKKAQTGLFGIFGKKKQEPIDSGKYFNNAIKYYQDLADYRTAKGQTIQAAPAALAEKAKYEKKLADYNARMAASEANLKKIQERGADKYLVEKPKRKGGAVKPKKKK